MFVYCCTLLQFSSVQARDRPSGLRTFAEVLLEPSGRDVWLGTAGTPEAAKITSLSDEQ